MLTSPHPDCGDRPDAVQRIVDAAERLFGERGYAGVSIRDIAEAAGVCKANVFHHFANKLELYRAVVENCGARFQRLLTHLTGPGGDTREMLTAFSGDHLHQMLEQPSAIRLLLRQLLDSTAGEDASVMENAVEHNFGLAAQVFAELKHQGRLRRDIDPRVLAMTLLGSHLSYFLLRNMLAHSPKGEDIRDPQAYDRAVLELLLGGALPPAEPKTE